MNDAALIERWPNTRQPWRWRSAAARKWISQSLWRSLMEIRRTVLGILTLATGATLFDGVWQAAQAQAITNIKARVIAVNIPGASAISQVGTFLNTPVPPACANPIPTKFPTFTQPGAVLDPNRVLVGSLSNFGAPLAVGVGSEGSFLSIDPSGPRILSVPP